MQKIVLAMNAFMLYNVGITIKTLRRSIKGLAIGRVPIFIVI